MSHVHSAKRSMVRDAEGFQGAEYAVVTALIIGAALAALAALGVALNGDVASLSQVIHI
jgi:Flp pilus assembly pilin Flp